MTIPQTPSSESRRMKLAWDREKHLQVLGERVFDVLVIGGGATGCSVARDAALRGLDVCLVERSDLASGTSSRSTRFIHGGLRYLRTAEFAFVREGLLERAILMSVAPHLVHSMEFLFPARSDAGLSRWKLRLGVALYDLLAGRNRLPGSRSLSAGATLNLEPGLRADGLRGSVIYRDGAADDARLVVETAISAVEAGAIVCLHVEVERLVPSETGPAVVVMKDRLSGASLGARAAVVINACGAWTGTLFPHAAGTAKSRGGNRLRRSRGSHVVVFREVLPLSRVVVMPSREDGRLLFAVPAGDFTYLGTTEVDHTGPLEPVRAEAAEVDYILRVAEEVFDAPLLSRGKVLCTWAGIRPLLDRAQLPTGQLSRDFRIFQEAPGIVTVVGGKLTSCRRMAETALDMAAGILAARFGRRADRCITGWKLFPGAEGRPPEGESEAPPGLDASVVKHLADTYGSRAAGILRRVAQAPSLGAPFTAGCPVTPSEIIHLIENEGAVRLADILYRRLHPLMMEARMSSPQGTAVAEGAAKILQSWLGWTAERRLRELADAKEEWKREFSVPGPALSDV
jgi:glycerol-3-phosphate dehydrogenase